MIVRADDFIARPSPIPTDDTIPEEKRSHFVKAGMAESTLGTDCLEDMVHPDLDVVLTEQHTFLTQ